MWSALTHLVVFHYILPLATTFIDAEGCISMLPCWLIDWLDVCMLMPWSWVPSVGGWLIDAFLIGLPTWYFVSMMDLYYTHYDLLSPTTPFPVAVVLGSWHYGHWTLLFNYDTFPTNCSTQITVPQIVDVTYQLMWPSAICISSMCWTPRLPSLVFFLYTAITYSHLHALSLTSKFNDLSSEDWEQHLLLSDQDLPWLTLPAYVRPKASHLNTLHLSTQMVSSFKYFIYWVIKHFKHFSLACFNASVKISPHVSQKRLRFGDNVGKR